MFWLIGFALLDFTLTAALLSMSGPEFELNPIARYLFVQFGINGLFFLKAVSMLIVLPTYALLDRPGVRYVAYRWLLFSVFLIAHVFASAAAVESILIVTNANH